MKLSEKIKEVKSSEITMEEGFKNNEVVDIQKLLESIDNLQDQLKMLEVSKSKIAEKLILYKGLHLFLTHNIP